VIIQFQNDITIYITVSRDTITLHWK